jgi:hypothetical protein
VPPRRTSSFTGIASSTSLPITTPEKRSGSWSTQRTRSPQAASAACWRARSDPETSTMV